MRSTSPADATRQARCHSRGNRFAGPETTPDGSRSCSRKRFQCSREHAPEAAARAHHAQDLQRVADVDVERAQVAELARGLRVVPEPARRRRDLDAAHEVEPRELLHRARAQVRLAARPRCRRCRTGRSAARRSRASSRSATSRATKRTGSSTSLIASGAITPACAPSSSASSSVSSVSRARRRGEPDPRLDGPLAGLREPRLVLARLLDDDPDHALAAALVELVPLAGRAHHEDHVGAAPALDQVADQATLIGVVRLAVGRQARDDRDRQSAARSVVLERSHALDSTSPARADPERRAGRRRAGCRRVTVTKIAAPGNTASHQARGVGLRDGQDRAPGDDLRRDADAQERQARLGQDRARDAERHRRPAPARSRWAARGAA